MGILACFHYGGRAVHWQLAERFFSVPSSVIQAKKSFVKSYWPVSMPCRSPDSQYPVRGPARFVRFGSGG